LTKLLYILSSRAEDPNSCDGNSFHLSYEHPAINSPPLAGGDEGEGEFSLLVHPSPSQAPPQRGSCPGGRLSEPAATPPSPIKGEGKRRLNDSSIHNNGLSGDVI
jgi:hypothetical protein